MPESLGSNDGTTTSKKGEPHKPSLALEAGRKVVESIRWIFEVGAIACAVLGAYFLYVQLNLMRESNQITRESLEFAKASARDSAQDATESLEASKRVAAAAERTAKAAEQTASSARDNLTNARLALERTERPWIMDEVTRYEAINFTTGDNFFRFYLKNNGRSPAINVRPFGCTVLGPNGLTEGDDFAHTKSDCAPRKNITVIGAGDEQWIGLGVRLDDAQAADLQAGKLMLSVITGAIYTDQFGRAHYSEFCTVAVFATKTWNNCDNRKNRAN